MLWYIASVTTQTSYAVDEQATTLHQSPDFTGVNHGASTSTSDFEPNIVPVQSQAVQVNLPKEGVDVGCQVDTRGHQLMMISVDTQTPWCKSQRPAPKLKRSAPSLK